MRYDSRRQSGYGRKIRIPLTGPTVHEEVIRVEATVTVAGVQETRVFDAEPNQVWEFEWDGYDIRGRQVNRATASVSISHIYPQWYSVPSGWQSSPLWGLPPTGVEVNEQNRFAFGETRTNAWWQVQLGQDRIVESASLGGWTINEHHAISRQSNSRGWVQFLEQGDGPGRTVGSSQITTIADSNAGIESPYGVHALADGSLIVAGGWSNQVYRVHPDGSVVVVAGTGDPGSAGDGGLAVMATLNVPAGVALGPDGSIYVAEELGNRVRRIGTDGIIQTVAGTGVAGFSGDGGPAEQAQLNSPYDVEVDTEGNLFIVDWRNHRVRRVGTNGIIQTIVGTDESGYNGDGILAVEATLTTPGGIALGNDGSLYIGDWGNHRVRRVTPDGMIYTVAGNGEQAGVADGVPANQTSVSYPDSVAVNQRGEVFIAEWGENRVRMVNIDGIIQTVAGNGMFGYGGDGGLPANSQLAGPIGVAVGPNGHIYIGDTGNGRVRAVIIDELEVPDFGYAAPSRSGDRVYLFDEFGRHVETRHSKTGATIRTFTYDNQSRLSAIADGDGNTTTIVRDSLGYPSAIESPDGHVTSLQVDSNGYLKAITDPKQNSWILEHNAMGLLESFTNRRGAQSSFHYDPDSGELVADIDPAGGGWTLDRIIGDRSSETMMETAGGRPFSFKVEFDQEGGRWHTNTTPDGLASIHYRNPARGITITERADGVVTERYDLADQRFGMASPIPSVQTTTLPSGLSRQATMQRDTVLADPGQPLSLISLVNQVTVNGRTGVLSFDAANREWTMQSPVGRQAMITVDLQGRPVETIQAGLATTSYLYDDRGRPSEIKSSDGDSVRTINYQYHAEGHQAGYLAAITDPLQRTTQFEYDEAGRITRQIFPDQRFVEFDYDAEGNLVSLTPPGRSAHRFEYTALDNRESYEPPELPGADSVTIYRYNLDRQLEEIVRPGGELVEFGYDFAGRLDAVSHDAATVNYSYHPQTGQLSEISTSDGIVLSYTWDGFLPKSESWSGAVLGTVSWEYDNNFWLSGETAANHSVFYLYDNDGLLTQAGQLVLTPHPDHGLLAGTELGDIVGTRSYNAFGELLAREVEIDEIPVYQAHCTRDQLGRIEQQTLVVEGSSETWTYHYDDAGRLEMVERNGLTEHVYVYDDNGNRIQHTGPGGVVTVADYDEQDRITQYGDIVYTHTEAGERLTRTDALGTTTYTYDAQTNLREVVLTDGTVIEYLIDGRDRRVGKRVNGQVQKTWLYRDQLSPVAQFDGAGNLTHRFVYAEQSHSPSWMVIFDPLTEDEKHYRIISDHLGSIRLVIEVETGAIAQRMDYGPFGKVLVDTNPGFQPFGFAGGIYDRDTGLARFGARDYDPEVGRWTAKDPIDFRAGDSNIYAYVASDAINFFDPSGLIRWTFLACTALNAGWCYYSARREIKLLYESTELLRDQINRIDQRLATCSDLETRIVLLDNRRKLAQMLNARIGDSGLFSTMAFIDVPKAAAIEAGCALFLVLPVP